MSLLAALAQQKRETIRARINAGLDRARKEGKVLGRPLNVFDCKKRSGCVVKARESA